MRNNASKVQIFQRKVSWMKCRCPAVLELCMSVSHYSCQQEKHSRCTWKIHRGIACRSKRQTRLRYPINFMWIRKASFELINFPLLWFPEALVSSTQVLNISFLLTPFLFPCHHTAWQTLPYCSLLWRYSVPLHHGVIKQKVYNPPCRNLQPLQQ